MNYLSDYTNDAQTELFNKVGAFFAFSTEQLNKARKEGVLYVNLGAGLICPKGNAKELVTGLTKIQDIGIEKDIADNGIKAIIHRELGNHECQITMDYSEVVDILEPYGVSEQQVIEEWNEFWKKCVDNDWF